LSTSKQLIKSIYGWTSRGCKTNRLWRGSDRGCRPSDTSRHDPLSQELERVGGGIIPPPISHPNAGIEKILSVRWEAHAVIKDAALGERHNY